MGDSRRMNTFTQHDMREELQRALDGDTDGIDQNAIIETIQQRYGTVPLDTVASEEFWEIVAAAVLP